jgi:hypothetical protein
MSADRPWCMAWVGTVCHNDGQEATGGEVSTRHDLVTTSLMVRLKEETTPTRSLRRFSATRGV